MIADLCTLTEKVVLTGYWGRLAGPLIEYKVGQASRAVD